MTVALSSVAVFGLAACAPPGADDSEEGGIAGDGEIHVGFLSPLTGPIADAGTEMQEGWDLYWEVHGNQVGDITIETTVEDSAGDPDTALTHAERLVEREGADLIVGPLAANTALAVSDYTYAQGVPNLHPVASADALTQGAYDELTMRVGSMAGSQTNFPGGNWAYEEGHRTAITLCPDYAFGWDSCAGFVRTFTEAGGEIVDQLWSPLGTQDYSSYVTQMQNADVDMAYIAMPGGSDGPNFLRTFNEFGLADELPILTNNSALDQPTLQDLGGDVEGLHSVAYYAEGLDDPATQEFLEAYEDNEGRLPSQNVSGGWVTAMVLARTLEATGGEFTGEELIAEARESLLEDTPYGPVSFDDYNNLVGSVHIREVVEREDGEYWNVPIETYEEVSQFWTWDPDEYLEGEEYSRSHQGES